MKKIGSLLFFLSLFVCSVQAQDLLVYESESKLVWADFKGEPPKFDSAGARISTTIQMKAGKVNIWTGSTTYSAWGIMFPRHSWVKKEYKDDYTLNHEQLHFDISELVAKRLKIFINQQKVNSGKKVATEIFNRY
ncbi:hypothetical protein [Rufibacter roseus]|uniref:DUF922 domain-containing protein n=2 Tax=Rufibacter roseus TaxID=1567108 RepID=A0ABW2DM37_9BACT|nr:hypothetical protein [Rufibacter roseus]